MSQFIQRVVNYVANEVIIKGLANSRTFQRFAVRTSRQYEEIAKQGTDKLNETLESFARQKTIAGDPARFASSLSGPPPPPLSGIPGFASAFIKEIRKDISRS